MYLAISYDKPGHVPYMKVLFRGQRDLPRGFSTGIRHGAPEIVTEEVLMLNYILRLDHLQLQSIHVHYQWTWSFTELRVVSYDHLWRVWLAIGGRFLSRTHGTNPSGTCACSIRVDTNVFPNMWFSEDFAVLSWLYFHSDRTAAVIYEQIES